MKKFEALQDYFNGLKLVKKGKFDAWVETLTVKRMHKQTEKGFLLCEIQYEANFSFEECCQHPSFMVAVVMAWLLENDAGRNPEREGEPRMDGSAIGDGQYNLGIQLTFVEKIYLHEDTSGMIQIKGVKYTGGEQEADAASEISLEHKTSA